MSVNIFDIRDTHIDDDVMLEQVTEPVDTEQEVDENDDEFIILNEEDDAEEITPEELEEINEAAANKSPFYKLLVMQTNFFIKRPATIILNDVFFRRTIKKGMAAAKTQDEIQSQLDNLYKNLNGIKKYYKNKTETGNIIPVADKKIKKAVLDGQVKFIEDSIATLEKKKK